MNITVEHILDGRPVEIAERVLELREIIQEVLPGAREKAIRGWGILAYSRKRIFLWIAPARTSVFVGFLRGVDLHDPRGLLIRKAGAKGARNLESPPGREIPRAALRRFLLQAWDLEN